MHNTRMFPAYSGLAPDVFELVRAGGQDREITDIWEGDAELTLGARTIEDLNAIAPREILKGYRFSFGYTSTAAPCSLDWGEMRVALDHLAQNTRHLVWGPGRHGMARSLYSYFRMVEEALFVELSCDLEQLEADHEPRHFPDDPHSSNTWGILPPRTYFRFDAAAVAAEAEQAYAYGKDMPALP